MKHMTFQAYADKITTDKSLVLLNTIIDKSLSDNTNEIHQRYPSLKSLIEIMKPKINRVDKISTPNFIKDVFDNDNGFASYSEIEVPDELIICLTNELYGVDTPENLNDKQVSIIKVLAVYIIISTYTA
jgi:hypothetical protein